MQTELPMLHRALEQFLGPAGVGAHQRRADVANPIVPPPSVRVLQGQTKRRVQDLAKSGFAHFHQFLVLPSCRAPRCLLPLENRHRMFEGFQVYRPYARTSTILKGIANRFIKGGWSGWGGTRVLIASREPLPLKKLVTEVTGEVDISFAMSLGSRGNIPKLTVQVMHGSGAILGYIKLPLTDLATKCVRHESEVLERLSGFATLRPHIPKMLHAGKWAGGYLLFQSPGPSRQGPVGFAPTHETFLRNLGAIYRVHKPGFTVVEEVGARWQRVLPFIDVELKELGARALDRARRELVGLAMPCGIVHGDFAPWNTRLGDKHLFVFDWETAAWEAPILWDRFHFHAQVAGLLNIDSGWRLPNRSRVETASFLLYLLSSVCQSLEEEDFDDPGIGYRKQILLRELS